jgi:cobalamin biosynthesis protein CobT
MKKAEFFSRFDQAASYRHAAEATDDPDECRQHILEAHAAVIALSNALVAEDNDEGDEEEEGQDEEENDDEGRAAADEEDEEEEDEDDRGARSLFDDIHAAFDGGGSIK